jgi:hypothetical protein
MTRRVVLAAMLLGLVPPVGTAQVYQYAVPAQDVAGKEITAYLWVPPEADRLRGVLVGGQTLMEPAFAGDPAVRQACAAEKLAIVYFSPALDAQFDYRAKDSPARLQKALDDLAEASGYRELAAAPLFPFGHSVSSIFASHVVCWNPGRCFGSMPFKGGLSLPPDAPQATVAGVPLLVIKGQFEEFGPGPSGALRDFENRETSWKGMREILLGLRAKDERNLIAYLVEPGASHFAWSQRLAPYAAGFIREAARQRIPDWPVDAKEPVKCRMIDPAAGSLSGGDIGKDAPAAGYGAFKGDKGKAFWHLSTELAKMADALHADLFAKRPQFVTFADPKTGKPILVGHDLRLRLGPTWVGPDTFRVAGTFLDKAPDKYPKVEGTVGHGEGTVQFRAFGGTVQQTGPDTFRVSPDGRGRIRAEILAFHPGDSTYRYAEQQGRMGLPEQLKQGKPQAISFPPVGRLKAGGVPARLQATSDSGLPVRYYVESGPAAVEGKMLRPADWPRRAKGPVTVTVVAYQYGSAVEPLVQSAEPVRQVIPMDP